jgi:hypothetical protein
MYFPRSGREKFFITIFTLMTITLVIMASYRLQQFISWKSKEIDFSNTSVLIQRNINNLEVQLREIEQLNKIIPVVDYNLAYFVRESDEYVLYLNKGGNVEKSGLVVPIQKDPYYDPYPELKYRDLDIFAHISPDGQKVAYLAKEDPKDLGQLSIYVSDIDGKNTEELVRPNYEYEVGSIDMHFFWDAKGENITYLETSGNAGATLFSINIETKKRDQILSENIDLEDDLEGIKVEVIPAGYFE